MSRDIVRAARCGSAGMYRRGLSTDERPPRQAGSWFERSRATALEKAVLAATAAVGALRDPTRADLVAALGDTTGDLALRAMRSKMLADEVGREILAEKPVVRESIDMGLLRSLPPGSFGRAYAEFMDAHGFDAEGRPAVKYVDDAEAAYVMLRYREVHDFLHVLTGLDTSVEAEVIQKWLELLQTGLPMTLLSATVGPLRLSGQDRRLLLTEWAPWAARAAVQMPFFLNIYYERLFEYDLKQLRRDLDIPPLPRSAPTWQR
jgi:ubiquinone biosynthesis protein COQ4